MPCPTMTRTLTLVPRWAGHADSDFYPWLIRERPRGFDTVRALEMPEPHLPTPENWIPALTQALGAVPAPGSVLMGHSVGCQGLLRYLSALPPGASVEGVVLVAAWWTVDAPWDSLRPWLNVSLDLPRLRAVSPRFIVLLSDNDPFTSDFRENGRLWKELLGAEVVFVPGARHFNGLSEPAVLETLNTSFPGPVRAP
jgi:predicted alpha/beta hydrolase family esterase